MSPPPAARARRCRRRPISPASSRPSEVLGLFFAAGLLYMAAGAIAAVIHAVAGGYWMHWLSLHLLLLGGVSQLVLGAGQFFTCAFLATDPPPRRLVVAQLACWSGGTVLVATGVPTGLAGLAEAGGGLIAAGLVLFAVALRGMERRSLQRAPWALRWYQASAACLSLGALIGVLLARGTTWPYGDLLGAHLALNLAGWLGTSIVGTLHTFFPSLTQTQLRHPRLQRPTFALWVVGVLGLALGAAFTSPVVLACGWGALLLAAGLLATNVLASLRLAPRPLTLPARLLALAQLYLIAGLAIALVATIRSGASGPSVGAPRDALAVLLLAGWIGLTVTGSLLHLLAILGRIRRFSIAMPRPRPAPERVITVAMGISLAALALAQLAAVTSLETPATVLTLACAAALAVRVIILGARALAPRRASQSG